MTYAVVFPGQGSQTPGMGQDFFSAVPAAREAFAEASDAVGFDVADMCFSGDERLNQTEFTQPCLLTMEIAALRALQAEYGLHAAWFGGHSLGEYTALAAAGVISLGGAARTVRLRGKLMQAAVPIGEGAMAAVIGTALDADRIREIADRAGADAANLNSPGQVVVSGPAAAIAGLEKTLQEAMAGTRLRYMPLKVSAPFHSRLMRGIEPEFRAHLEATSAAWDVAKAVAVTSNFAGGFHTGERAALIGALTRQISAPVRWVENMHALAKTGARIVEIGPARPLKAFFKAIGAEIEAVTTLDQGRALLAPG